MPGQNAETLYHLANSHAAAGKLDRAVAAYLRAIELRPEFIEAHFKLGNALAKSAKPNEAAQSFRRVLQLDPNHVDAMINLGNTLLAAGAADEAVALYRRVLGMQPNHFLAHNNLAAGLVMAGQFAEALEFARRAAAMRPDYPPAHRNLGDALAALGKWADAAESYKKLVELDAARPNADPGATADAKMKLGTAMKHLGRFNDAISLFREAIALSGDGLEPRDLLAKAYWENGDMDEALAVARQAVQIHPTDAKAHNSLGNVFRGAGRLTEAIECYARSAELSPGDCVAASNRLFCLQFHPDYDAHRQLAEHRLWDDKYAKPLRESIVPHPNDRSADRRLKVGYVSPNFWTHCQSLFTEPLLANHDHQRFEIFCYSSVAQPDAVTQRLKGYADVWRSCVGMTDATLAAVVRQDRIDILVDLTMHMAQGLLLMARKPAPVQVTWLAYPGTTGLATMDYRLTDPYLDPVTLHDDRYVERSIRLADTFWCYDPWGMEWDRSPAAEPLPEPGPLPATLNGYATFGCLNDFCKINDGVLKRWARIIRSVDGSRLRLLAPNGEPRQRVRRRLAELGVAGQRIEFVTRRPRRAYLQEFRRIDLCLDTLPYNGHTTSLDSLWMGVPVLTQVGPTVVGRAGWSQLSNLGLTELAAHGDDAFVQLAVEWARDLPRLAELRRTLRPRMLASPLCDKPRFARSIEAAYRQMWQQWCKFPRP